MTCSICGNPFPCSHSARNTIFLEEEGANVSSQPPEQRLWRNEVIARVRRHRARRGRAGNSGAMELDFPAPEISSEEPWPVWEAPVGSATQEIKHAAQSSQPPSSAPKIIRFPASPFSRWPVAEQPFEAEQLQDELGEPARILEAEPELGAISHQPAPAAPPPQQMELPCFDDIQLDSDAHKALEIVEPVPQAAPLGRRALAGVADLGIVLLSSLAFKIAFNQLAEDDPHTKAAMLCGVTVAGALWMVYQYLFLVHGTRTPGMLLANLELSTFGGSPVNRKGRRARALATAISTFSLGLGFAWALLDEDQLGWHDRMTGTVVKESGQSGERFDRVYD